MELGWIYSLQAYIRLLQLQIYAILCIVIKWAASWDGYEDDRRFWSQFGSSEDSLELLKPGPPNVWTAMVYWGICKLTHFIAKLGSCTYRHGEGEKKSTHTKVCCLPSFHQILDSRAIAHHHSRHCAVTTTKHIICVAETHPVCIQYQMFGDWEGQWWVGSWGGGVAA